MKAEQPTSDLLPVGRVGHSAIGSVTDALTRAILFAFTLALAHSACAQTFTILHAFNALDGAWPEAGLTIDGAGNLYGTANKGTGSCGVGTPPGCGVDFRLSKQDAAWVYTVLYDFSNCGEDGDGPGAVTLGRDGILYGTTVGGGGVGCYQIFGYSRGCGTVYKLRPTHAPCKAASCPWAETVPYRFNESDGAHPFVTRPRLTTG